MTDFTEDLPQISWFFSHFHDYPEYCRKFSDFDIGIQNTICERFQKVFSASINIFFKNRHCKTSLRLVSKIASLIIISY